MAYILRSVQVLTMLLAPDVPQTIFIRAQSDLEFTSACPQIMPPIFLQLPTSRQVVPAISKGAAFYET